MAATKDRVMYAAETAKPYFERALRDEEFRDNLRTAFAAARAIYEELSQRSLADAASHAATDDDIHANLRRAIGELRQAADRIQEREARESSHGFRNVLLLLGGIAVGVFFNPFTGRTTRRWVAGKVGGSDSGYGGASPNGSQQ
jgi:hypothetical protein